MKKIILEMYLKKNLGDDLFLKIILERYKKAKFYTFPLTSDYKKNFKIYNNIKFNKSFITKFLNFSSRLFKNSKFSSFNIIKKKCDSLVVLGGSMFIENDTNPANISRKIERIYKSVNKPLYVLGSNFGPYKSDFYYNEYKNIFKGAEDVCFRESYSKNIFKGANNIRFESDIVFSLDTKSYKKENKKNVVISVIDLVDRTNLSNYKDNYERGIINLSKKFIDKGYNVTLMGFCKLENDDKCIKNIINNIDKNYKDKIFSYSYDGNIDEALNVISTSEYIVGTRFHACILGILFDKKTLPIIYSDKTLNILNDLKFNGDYIFIDENIENEIKNLNIKNIKKYNGDLNKIIESSNRQFLKLDEFLNSEGDK